MTAYNKTLTETVGADDSVRTQFSYVFVTNSVRTSLSLMLRLLRRPVRYFTIDLPPVHAYVEPGDTVWVSHVLMPWTTEYDGSDWTTYPMLVVSITDSVQPAKVSLKCIDLREIYCTWWSPFRTDIGMTPDLNGIAILDRAGGWYTTRDQLAYGERPGGDNVFQEVLANTQLIDGAGLWIQGGADVNHLLNSTFSEGTGNSFTNWTSTTSGAAIAVEWKLYTLIDALGFQRSCQLATYAAGENAYLSQTVNTMGNKKLYARVFYKNGGAYDDLTLRIQRSDNSTYWRDSDSTWQGSATDNVISPKSGVVNSLRWVSNLIDLTGITCNLTVSLGHFSCASALAQITQLQGCELIEMTTDTGPYCRWRSPLPTKAAAVTRVRDLTYIVNSTAVGVLSTERGFVKVTVTPHWDHADLVDQEIKYVWCSDFDNATDNNFFRFYYQRIDASLGGWYFDQKNGGTAYAVTGANLVTRDTAYTVVGRWNSAGNDLGLPGQFMDVWVNGTKSGTGSGGYPIQGADYVCNVYLGATPNALGVSAYTGFDGHFTDLVIGEHCPVDDELLRL